MKRTVTASGSQSAKRSKSSSSGSSGTKVPRGIKLNEINITRVIGTQIPIQGNAGWLVAATNSTTLGVAYGLQGVTFFSSGITYSTVAMPGIADIQAMFEKAMIVKVTVEMTGRAAEVNANPGSAPNSTAVARGWIANDYNDFGTLTVDQTQQQSGCKTFLLSEGKKFKWTLRPMYQRQIYNSVAAAAYEPARGYLSTGYDVPHYGTRISLETDEIGWQTVYFSVRYHIKLQGVK